MVATNRKRVISIVCMLAMLLMMGISPASASSDLDESVILEKLGMEAFYPSDVFEVTKVTDKRVIFTAIEDEKAVIEIKLSAPFDNDKEYQTEELIDAYQYEANKEIDRKTFSAAYFEILDRFVDSEEYGSTTILSSITNYVEYETKEYDEMKMICRTCCWRNLNDMNSYLYNIVMSVPLDEYDYYYEYFELIRVGLDDADL